jgi:hypothetical protein
MDEAWKRQDDSPAPAENPAPRGNAEPDRREVEKSKLQLERVLGH